MYDDAKAKFSVLSLSYISPFGTSDSGTLSLRPLNRNLPADTLTSKKRAVCACAIPMLSKLSSGLTKDNQTTCFNKSDEKVARNHSNILPNSFFSRFT